MGAAASAQSFNHEGAVREAEIMMKPHSKRPNHLELQQNGNNDGLKMPVPPHLERTQTNAPSPRVRASASPRSMTHSQRSVTGDLALEIPTLKAARFEQHAQSQSSTPSKSVKNCSPTSGRSPSQYRRAKSTEVWRADQTPPTVEKMVKSLPLSPAGVTKAMWHESEPNLPPEIDSPSSNRSADSKKALLVPTPPPAAGPDTAKPRARAPRRRQMSTLRVAQAGSSMAETVPPSTSSCRTPSASALAPRHSVAPNQMHTHWHGHHHTHLKQENHRQRRLSLTLPDKESSHAGSIALSLARRRKPNATTMIEIDLSSGSVVTPVPTSTSSVEIPRPAAPWHLGAISMPSLFDLSTALIGSQTQFRSEPVALEGLPFEFDELSPSSDSSDPSDAVNAEWARGQSELESEHVHTPVSTAFHSVSVGDPEGAHEI